jgi:hypothetical protein
MIIQYAVSTSHEPIIASGSTGAGSAILAAGFFTVIGAAIPLVYQGFFVHNQNRREDYWLGVNAAGDLIAAARQILRKRLNVTATGNSDVTRTADLIAAARQILRKRPNVTATGNSDVTRPAAKEDDLRDVFSILTPPMRAWC